MTQTKIANDPKKAAIAHQLKRKLLFKPCESKEDLQNWIKIYLDVELPDGCTDPQSNSSPMDLLWEIYHNCRINNPDISEYLAYAARDSFKTFTAAILEVLCVVHLDRSVAHMAAIESQAKKSQQYIKKHFNRPFLREYMTSTNERMVELTRYYNPVTGDSITQKEWKALPVFEQVNYEEKKNYVNIIICTVAGANSEHVPFMVIDEVDVVTNPDAYEEAKFIPAPMFGFMPITLYTSTRKYSFGLVQKEIDQAATDPERNLQIRHWNIVDVTRKCPPSLHRPDLPKLRVFRSDENLKTISAEDWAILPTEQQNEYVECEAYQGCIQNCKLFAVCQGRLAHVERKVRDWTFFKPIKHVQKLFRKVDASKAKAQLMCWKPSTEGLIYPRFDRALHLKTPAEIYKLITTEEAPPGFGKAELIAFAQERGFPFYSGMDFGFTHNFAVVTGFKDGERFFVLDVISIAELDLPQKLELCEGALKPYGSIIYPDTAYPSDIKSFKRAGFSMRDWKKDKGSVLAGIEIVRMKMMPVFGAQPELYFLKEDEGCELLATRVSQYHWTQDTAGRSTNQPDEEDDDECFTANTEALTREGWKSLRDVTLTDEVFQIDHNGNGSFARPDKIIAKKYSGKMYRVEHDHLEFDATESHLHAVMTQFDWKVKKRFHLTKKAIEDLSIESYWPNNIPFWEEGMGVFSQGEDEAWLAGFWLAEGCFDKYRPTFIIIDQTKKQWQQKVREVATRLGWNWSETCNGDSIRFVFLGQKERALKWRDLFGCLSHEKTLLFGTVFDMTKEERSALWDGYMAGDGSRTQSCWYFDSVSKNLIDGIQLLTMMLGYGCRIVSYDCMRAGRKIVNPVGKEYVSKQSYRGHVLRHGWVTHLKKKKLRQYDIMNEDVFCVKMPQGFFLARTNGKPFVAGNCDALRYVIMNIFSPRTKVKVETTIDNTPTHVQDAMRREYRMENWALKVIAEQTGGAFDDVEQIDTSTSRGKKGNFAWDIA